MNQKGQQSLQMNELNDQLPTQHQNLQEGGERKKVQQNEQTQNEQLYQSLLVQKQQEKVSKNNQELQRQFTNQQQQQAFQESMAQVPKQPKNTNENQNFEQGAGSFSMVKQTQFISDRENQVSTQLVSTGQSFDDQNRYSLSTRSMADANFQSSHNTSSLNTFHYIKSLINIPGSTEQMERVSQQLDNSNNNLPKNQSEQSMGHSSNNLNQIFTQNNINTNNTYNPNSTTNNISYHTSNPLIGTSNTAINLNNNTNIPTNSINYNLHLNQPVQFQNNQQAGLNPMMTLQQTPTYSQISSLGQQQIPQINPPLISSQFPQMQPANIQFMYPHMMYPQRSFQLNQPNYNFVSIPNQNLVIQQQPQQQNQSQHQQSIVFNQNQGIIQGESSINQAFNQQMPNPLSQQPQLYMQPITQQQQQLQNQQFNNLNALIANQNLMSTNNIVQNQNTAGSASQNINCSINVGQQQMVTFPNQTQSYYQQSNPAFQNNKLDFLQQNSGSQSSIPQRSMQIPNDRKNLQEQFSSSSNLHPYQQNQAFSEKLPQLSDQMNESEKMPSNLNSSAKSVLQSNEGYNSQKNSNQSNYQQSNQKIKLEEDSYQQSSIHNKFTNQELQKFQDTQATQIKSSQIEQNPLAQQSIKKQLQNIKKNDSIFHSEDTILEKNSEMLDTNQDKQKPYEKKQSTSVEQLPMENVQQSNNNQKKKRKGRRQGDVTVNKANKADQKIELHIDDKSQGQSQSSVQSVKQNEEQIKIQQQMKQGVNSPNNQNLMFLHKNVEKKFLNQSDTPIEEQFSSNKKTLQNPLESTKKQETQGHSGYKKIKIQQSGQQGNQAIFTQPKSASSPSGVNQLEIKNEQNIKSNTQDDQQIFQNQFYNYVNIPQLNEMRSYHFQQQTQELESQFQGQSRSLNAVAHQNQQIIQEPQLQTNFFQQLPISNQQPVVENKSQTYDLETEQQPKESRQKQGQFLNVQTNQSPRIELAADYNIQNNTTKNQFQQQINPSQNLAADSFTPFNHPEINVHERIIQYMQPNQIAISEQTEQLNNEQNFQEFQGNMQISLLQSQSSNILNNQISLLSFLIDSIQSNLDTNKQQFETLAQTLDIQSQLLADTVNSVRNVRQNVDDIILHLQDIQGQSGLLDFMRGRLKEYVRSNSNMLLDHDDSKLDPQTAFYSKYELVLKEGGDFKEPLIKDKNFVIDVSLIDTNTKRKICNIKPIPVRLRMYNYDNPPQIFESDYIKGILGQNVERGSCSFKKIHIKQVTSHQRQKSMFIVVEPDIERFYGLPPVKISVQPTIRSDPTGQRGVDQLKSQNETGKCKQELQPLEDNINEKISAMKESIKKEDEISEIQEKTTQKGQKRTSQQSQKSNSKEVKKQSSEEKPKPKKKGSRSKKNNDEKNNNVNQQECDIIQYQINPILIKPLILEQIIVKSKNNVSSKTINE